MNPEGGEREVETGDAFASVSPGFKLTSRMSDLGQNTWSF